MAEYKCVVGFFERDPLNERDYGVELQLCRYAEGRSEYELASWAEDSSQYDSLKSTQAPGLFLQMNDARSESSEMPDHPFREEEPAAVARECYFSAMET